jgi:hypothetical protein
MSVAIATPTAVDQIIARLLAMPPAQTPQMRRILPGLVQRLVDGIAEMRHRREQAEPSLSRRRLRDIMGEINNDLLHVLRLLDELYDHAGDEPWLATTLHGSTGLLGDLTEYNSRVTWLREAAGRAADWQQAVAGSGRHSLAETLDWPTPELLCAAGIVQLRQLLRWQRGQTGKQQLCALAEQLWLAAGGAPSASPRRWLNHLATAQGHKQARVQAIQAVRRRIERLLGPEAQGEILEQARKQTRSQKIS